MPFFKKEIFIFLPLILISSLVIYFINPSQPNNNQDIVKKQSIPAGCSQDSKNGTTGLFKEIIKIELNNTTNIVPDIFTDENQKSAKIYREASNLSRFKFLCIDPCNFSVKNPPQFIKYPVNGFG